MSESGSCPGAPASAQVVAPLCEWLYRTVGIEPVCFYVWDRILAHCLPVWGETCTHERGTRLELALASVVDRVLATGGGEHIDPVSKDPVLGPLAPPWLDTVILLPYAMGSEPLGVLVMPNADRGRLEAHRETLDLIAPPTLLALRGLWEVRQATLQNQELQRSKHHLLALLKEVEERQRVIELLTHEVEQTKAHLEGIFENAAVGLVSVDRRGMIRSANEPAAVILGRPKPQMVNKRLGDLVPPAVREEIDQLLERALAGQTVKDVATLWPGSNMTRTIRVTLSPVRDDRGQILGGVGILRDTTEHDRMHRELTRAEKLVALGEMIAGVAHEMNNPLTSVLGYASLLLRSVSDPAIRAPLETIAREAERTARIVHNLLLYARQHRPDRRPTDINELLQQVIEQHADTLNTHRITVHRIFDPGIDMVSADPFQLQQVFLNLIMNAEQAIHEVRDQGHLTLRTSMNESIGHVVVEVEDDGPGIPPQYLSRVFDPFFTTKEVGKGTGLGLSICYGIIKEHNARISVRNRAGGGAIFTVELPLDKGEAPPEAESANPSQDLLFRKRILVVDDEPHIRLFFQQALSLFRCQVEVAASCKEALDKVRAQPFDLIIYDYRLPDGTGRELAHEILKMDSTLADRMLLITGDSLAAETHAYLGGVPYALMKPFDLPGLQAALRDILLSSNRTEVGH